MKGRSDNGRITFFEKGISFTDVNFYSSDLYARAMMRVLISARIHLKKC